MSVAPSGVWIVRVALLQTQMTSATILTPMRHELQTVLNLLLAAAAAAAVTALVLAKTVL